MLNGLNLRVICCDKSFNLQLFGTTFLHFYALCKEQEYSDEYKKALRFFSAAFEKEKKRLKLTPSSPKYPVFVLILSLIRMGIEIHAKCRQAWGQRDCDLQSREERIRTHLTGNLE